MWSKLDEVEARYERLTAELNDPGIASDAQRLQQVAKAHAGQWLVVKVDTDRLTEVAAQYRIMSLPTLAVIQHGRELARIVGVRPAPEIERFVVETTATRTTHAS